MTFTNTYIIKLAGVFYARSKVLLATAGILLLSLLVACASTDVDGGGGSDDTYAIKGTVSGLAEGETITLTLSPTGGVSETKDITANGDFSFDTKLANKDTYTVTTSSPDGKTCTVNPAGEQVMGDADVTNVAVTCTVANPPGTYSVSGSVTGAADNSLITVTLSHADSPESDPEDVTTADVTPNGDGTFSFAVPENKFYILSATSSTTDEICTPDTATLSAGRITANVTDAQVTCTIFTPTGSTYSVSGTVTGAADNSLLTINLLHTSILSPNPPDLTSIDVTPNGDGTFSFDAVPENKYYILSVSSTTPGEACTPAITAPSGPINMNVTGAQVTCTILPTIGGTVSGLANGETITLTLSPTGGVLETEVVTGDNDATAIDTFAFDTRLVNGDTYEVTTSSPAGKTCTVAPAGTQTMGDADVNITVTCEVVANTYTISGSVSGAEDNRLLTITLSYADTANPNPADITSTDVIPNTDGTFSFTSVPENKLYVLSVVSTTADEVCAPDVTTLSAPINEDVTGAQVTCRISPSHTISGSVSGAADNRLLTITLSYADTANPNPADISSIDVTLSGDGTFSFTGIPENKYYFLSASSTTADEVCTPDVTTFSGPINTDVTGAQVTCQIVRAYSIDGTVTRAATTSIIYIVLTVSDDNAGAGAISQTLKANPADGTFSFTDVPQNKFYTLEAFSHIVGETCTSSAPTPVQITANVTGAQVTCTASAGQTLRIDLYSQSYEASLTTVKVFIGDTAITDTSTSVTPTEVINGSDVTLFDLGDGFGENYYYDISINAGQYYAVTITSSSTNEGCGTAISAAGPINDDDTVLIICNSAIQPARR